MKSSNESLQENVARGLLFLALVSPIAAAFDVKKDENPRPEERFKAKTNGFSVEVFSLPDENSEGSTNNQLFFSIETTGATPAYYLPADREYLLSAKLYDAEGREISKTKMGKNIGSRWNELPATLALSQSRDSPYILFKTNSRDLRTWRIDHRTHVPYLFHVNQIFNIMPGRIYTLKVEFQLIVLGAQATPGVFNVIRIPPIHLPVRLRD